MARRIPCNLIAITSAACMRRTRQALRTADFVQCKLQIPASFAARLRNLKRAYNMRGLDSVVSAMIRKAMAEHSPNDLVAPPPPLDFDELKQIAVHIPREHYAYLRAVAHRNRGINLGVALETIGSYVDDLSSPGRQLSLIELLSHSHDH